MNKVIINKVDVSECGFYHPEYDNYCHIALAFSEDYGECLDCKNNPNCYYKQLQRAKTENEHYRKESYRLADGLNKTENLAFTYKQALQEIRDMAEKMYNTNDEDVERDLYIKLQDKINEVIGAE